VTTCVWEYIVSHGKHTETIWYMVAMKPMRFKTQGWVLLRKEEFGDKVKSAFGKNDLDFENQEFSDYFYVNASPEKFGYQFFHPRMIEYWLQNRHYGMFIHYDTMLVYMRVWQPQLWDMFKYIRSGFTPIVDWMHTVKVTMREVEELIPSYMTYLEARNLDEEDEIAKVVDDANSVQVECPDCSHRFKVAESAKRLKCPKCGAEGEV
jgi:ribosomal protein S27AE